MCCRKHTRWLTFTLCSHYWYTLVCLLHRVDINHSLLFTVLVGSLISFTQLHLSWSYVLSFEYSPSVARWFWVLRLPRHLFVWSATVCDLRIRLWIAVVVFLRITCCIACSIKSNCFALTCFTVLWRTTLLTTSNCRLFTWLNLCVTLSWLRLSFVTEWLLLLSKKSIQICYLLRLMLFLLLRNLGLTSRHSKLRFLLCLLNRVRDYWLFINGPTSLWTTSITL